MLAARLDDTRGHFPVRPEKDSFAGHAEEVRSTDERVPGGVSQMHNRRLLSLLRIPADACR